ncbi:MAG: phosphatidylserine/phosphatidylglycerophosphate/cardiolipin synthase family protein [Solirubrobacteraceae bacterium]
MIARTTVARIAACAALAVTLTLAHDGVRAVAADEDRYRTLFQDPGETPTTDLSLEQHAIALIAATPAGAHIGFAFRDFNRRPVADALIAAHRRGVVVDGVIDGGERSQRVVQDLQAALGADRLVLCGSPAFTFHSCITNVDPPSLQHNKFLTFSLLADGRADVVLQTSMNFLEPSQLSYYNDMVEIAGDHALYDAYVEFLMDMKAQARTDDRYEIRWGDDGRTAIFPSPRRQSDPFTDDTIVDRMNEIDCSEGGTIRAANMAFRSERIVILHKLIDLQRAGCDVEVVLSNADGDIMTGLLLAGIPVHPFFLRAVAPRPQVIVHDKFWLVDARSAVTGRRVKLTYAGSSNWRGDQQRSDDLLLRIDDDDVYADYLAYWEKIRSRAASDLPRPATDAVAPVSGHAVTPAAGPAGWHRTDVGVHVAASDGHLQTAGGLAWLRVRLSGAQTGSWELTGEHDGSSEQRVEIVAEGTTTVTHQAQDVFGRAGAVQSVEIRIDKTAPVVRGLPERCTLWPPNGRLVRVADVSASDDRSGLADLDVTATSNARDDAGDIVIADGRVYLRAEKRRSGRARVYEIRATASDVAGNVATSEAACVVPHSRGWHHPGGDGR